MNLNLLKVLFAGTSDFAAKHLEGLLCFKEDIKIVGILTKINKFIVGNRFNKNSIEILSKKFNIPILSPKTLKSVKSQSWIRDLRADVMIVVSYGLIFPKIILDMFPLGCFNVHASLLPRWRGAAPIQRAILFGDKITGITIIKMNEKLDSGDILYQKHCLIEEEDTSKTLCKKLKNIGSMSLFPILKSFFLGKILLKKQHEHLSVYANKIKKREALINWNVSAIHIKRMVQAFNPWPISYFFLKKNFFKVWKVEIINWDVRKYVPGTILLANKTGIRIAALDAIINILEIQSSGTKKMLVRDFLNSRQNLFIPGSILN